MDPAPLDTPADADLHHALVQTWNIAIPTAGPSRQALLAALAARVLHLMRHDFNRLTTSLYLLDVREHHYLEALRAPAEHIAARRLAEIILDREHEKALSRQKYSRCPAHPSPGPTRLGQSPHVDHDQNPAE